MNRKIIWVIILSMLYITSLASDEKSESGDKMSQELQTATFGGGCFWGVESAFQKVDGVKETAVGFMGGKTDDPTYHEICYTETGHVEVCQVKYDPDVVSYNVLLKVFFESHDPTQVNRQGPDVGTQYRTAIFYHDEEQKKLSESAISKIEIAKLLPRPIATEIVEAAEFFTAEEYHQQYFEKKGLSSHCGFPTGVKFDLLIEE